MTEQEAIKLLRLILEGAQRSRSVVRETFGKQPNLPQKDNRKDDQGEAPSLGDKTLASMFPYLFGEVNLVRVCTDLLGRVENGRGLAPVDFYNVIFLANREPLLHTWFISMSQELPRSNPTWLSGWDQGEE